MTPVDKNNITGQYDTVMKRVPVTEDEPKSLDDIGGMPEIVSDFITNNDFNIVRKKQNVILETYEQDFSKHIQANIV